MIHRINWGQRETHHQLTLDLNAKNQLCLRRTAWPKNKVSVRRATQRATFIGINLKTLYPVLLNINDIYWFALFQFLAYCKFCPVAQKIAHLHSRNAFIIINHQLFAEVRWQHPHDLQQAMASWRPSTTEAFTRPGGPLGTGGRCQEPLLTSTPGSTEAFTRPGGPLGLM